MKKKVRVHVFFLMQALDILDFKSRQRQMVLLFSKISRLALGPTQPHIQWTMFFFPGVKRVDREIYCSPLYSAEARNEWSNTSTSLLSPDTSPLGVQD
jgi:hypothetical protein